MKRHYGTNCVVVFHGYKNSNNSIKSAENRQWQNINKWTDVCLCETMYVQISQENYFIKRLKENSIYNGIDWEVQNFSVNTVINWILFWHCCKSIRKWCWHCYCPHSYSKGSEQSTSHRHWRGYWFSYAYVNNECILCSYLVSKKPGKGKQKPVFTLYKIWNKIFKIWFRILCSYTQLTDHAILRHQYSNNREN